VFGGGSFFALSYLAFREDSCVGGIALKVQPMTFVAFGFSALAVDLDIGLPIVNKLEDEEEDWGGRLLMRRVLADEDREGAFECSSPL